MPDTVWSRLYIVTNLIFTQPQEVLLSYFTEEETEAMVIYILKVAWRKWWYRVQIQAAALESVLLMLMHFSLLIL